MLTSFNYQNDQDGAPYNRHGKLCSHSSIQIDVLMILCFETRLCVALIDLQFWSLLEEMVLPYSLPLLDQNPSSGIE